MNQYGTLALRHWQRARPAELAMIEDQESFFTQLGEEVAAEILRRSDALAGPMSEDYLANLGMLNEARATAESEVLRELVFTEPEPTS
jgi:hypothetical protein